jgi:hypothetical protein
MFSTLFSRPKNNPTRIDEFLQSTFQQSWNYLEELSLAEADLQKATFEQILDNQADVDEGVNQVKMKFDTVFFNLFPKLIIKHRGDGSFQLMFYTETHQPEDIAQFYNNLKSTLGKGFFADHKFSSFEDRERIVNLSKGKFDSPKDEILHLWNHGRFTFTLNYQLEPLRQFLFIVNLAAERLPDHKPRTKGTILNALTHDIREIISRTPQKTEPFYENEEIKFVDYTFELNPPELGLFEQARIRIFDPEKRIHENIQTHITYYSKYEIDTSKTIIFCDALSKIYGKDNYGSTELKSHELDFLDDSEFWTGRSWLFNTSHCLQDLEDETQNTLYGVTITANPDEDGLCLHILVFNKMMDYQELMMPNG